MLDQNLVDEQLRNREPSDAALLEFAFRNMRRQRDLLHADFGKRTAADIRAAILREAGLDPDGKNRWERFLEATKAEPEPEPVQEATPPARLPPEPMPMRGRIFMPPKPPERFTHVTLDSFRVDFSGQAYADQLSAARQAVDAWVQLALAGKPACVALVGSQGNGKSHLLWGAVRALTDARIRCYARSWYRLADELRYGGSPPWLPGVVKEPYELRALVLDSSAVAIDEVCETAGTSFDESELGKIVKNAWDNRQALLVTTNVHPLSNLMGSAPADRFTVVQLTAPSGRNRE
jgi:hypothetical protein